MLGRKPSVPTVIFQAYSAAYRDRCLAIFAANCPGYFAPNQRSDYISFLDAPTPGYELCLIDGIVVGAFGLTGDAAVRNLNWVMLAPQSRGRGLGAALMARVVSQAQDAAVTCLQIAASQHSSGFFANYGAVGAEVIIGGWGPGMHRIDMELQLQ